MILVRLLEDVAGVRSGTSEVSRRASKQIGARETCVLHGL